jgi:hypothetical protein
MPKKISQKEKKKKNPLVKKIWESKIKQTPSKNVHVSYSSISTFNKCPKLWELQYLRNKVPFRQNIYTCFGNAMHETIQEWLTVMYYDTVKASNEMNLDKLLYANLVKAYKVGRAQMKGEHYSNSDQLNEFYLDGKHILDFLKKKRASYFTSKTMMLSGIETLLYQDIRPGVKFKGLIDLVFYHPNTETWTIMDIKTSTRGWNQKAKSNTNLTAQVVLYREFFAKQFDIDIDKIKLEYFVVKRRIPKDAEFAAALSRVQTFNPFGNSSGKNKTKQVLKSMDDFINETIDEEGKYFDKNYNCKNAFGKCEHCRSFLD